MSLIAWYPLNGNMNNYGCGDMDLTISSAPSFSDGKIGKGLSGGGTAKWTAEQTAKILNNNSLTICFWLKVLNTTSNNSIVLFGNETQATPNNRKFSIFNYPNANDLRLSWCNNTSANAIISTVETNFFPTNEWVHCAITYENPQVKIYRNGVLYKTYTATSASTSFAYQTDVFHACSYKILNDFRFYDNCLSAKEVKEISKGLVLHYPLDEDSFMMNAELLYNDPTFKSGNNNIKVYNNKGNGTVVHTRIARTAGNPTDSNYQIHIKTNGEANPNHGGFYFGNISSAGTTFRYFITAKIPIGYQINFHTNSTGDNSLYTWETSQAGTGNFEDYILNVRCGDRGTFSSTGFFALIGGSTATAEAPVEWDVASATAYKLKLTEVYDNSGYGNNGTVSGTLELNASEKILKKSTSFPTNTSKIVVKNLPTAGFATSYTFSWWGKGDLAGDMMWGFSNGNRVNYYSGLYYNTGDGSSNPYKTTAGVTITKPSADVWHHYAMTGDGTNALLYVDGVLYGTATTWKPITGSTIYFNGWNNSTDYCWNGSMCDFRIYVTALSAADIKELYETRYSISNKGDFFTRDIRELDNNVQLGRNGTLSAQEVCSGVGRKNLLKKSDVKPNQSSTTTVSYDDNTDTYTVTTPAGKTYEGGLRIGDSHSLIISWGEALTTSAEVFTPKSVIFRPDNNDYAVAGGLAGNDNTSRIIQNYGTIPANTWTKVHWTVKNSNEEKNPNHKDIYINDCFSMFTDSINEALTWKIRNIKCEKGIGPTPWTPAPEDNKLVVTESISKAKIYNNAVVCNNLIEY